MQYKIEVALDAELIERRGERRARLRALSICGLDRRAAFVAFTVLCGTPRLSTQRQDRIDLDERSAWQRGNADCGTCRIELRELVRHDFIDAREMREVCEIHGELHCEIEPASRFIGDGLQIVEHAIDLGIDAVNKLHGRGSNPICPDKYTVSPLRIACEYFRLPAVQRRYRWLASRDLRLVRRGELRYHEACNSGIQSHPAAAVIPSDEFRLHRQI